MSLAYLSPEWIAAVDRALAARFADEPPELVDELVVDQQVDDVAYRITVGPEGASARPVTGGDPAPDGCFRQSRATAEAIARGETDAHQAFLLGRLRFNGRVETLIEHRPALDWIATALESVMATTRFD